MASANATAWKRYGMDPQIKFFETACITDNAAGTIVLPGGTKWPGIGRD
jgi:hypothetical protein